MGLGCLLNGQVNVLGHLSWQVEEILRTSL